MTEITVRLSAEDRALLVRELADELERRHAGPMAAVAVPALLSLDEAAAQLAQRMPARSAARWARWLYESAPRGRVTGARKVAGRWWIPSDAIETLDQEGQ